MFEDTAKMTNQEADLYLISLIREGNPLAKEELVRKYVPMVKHIIRNYYASFLEFEDLLQEGLIGLLNAINEYKPEQYDVKFSSFAYICIIRKVYNIIKQSNGNKHKALNDAVSLYTYTNTDESRTFMDLIPTNDAKIDPETFVEQKVINASLNQVLRNHLSILEYTVIMLFLNGYTSSEIEEEIGIGAKAVDNARTRVKLKLRRIMNQYGSLLSPKVPAQVRKREDLYLDIRLGG